VARFVAKYAKYRHGVRTGRFMILADGQRQELSKELFAKFDRAGISEEEQNLGISSFIHNGLPEDKDTNEHFSPRSRISVFDSQRAQEMNGWTDEEREIVEMVLRNSPEYGRELIEITPKPVDKPWPAYDEATDPQQIVSIAKSIGISLEQVAEYERQNANREKVIKAVEAAQAFSEEEDGPEVVIEA